MVFIFHIGQSGLRTSIVVNSSVISVSAVTSEPFLESHSAHDVVIGHGVKTVECALYFLFRSDTGLEAGCDSGVGEAFPIHDLFLFEAPRFKEKGEDIVGLDELVFHGSFVEEKDLKWLLLILFGLI